MIRLITSPNLFEIARRIEYANKKYHSGFILIYVYYRNFLEYFLIVSAR